MRWVSALLVGVLGAAGGWLSAGTMLPEAPPEPGPDLPVARAQGGSLLPSPACPDESGLVSQLAALQAEVAAARAAELVTQGQMDAEIGAPVPWPDDVPEAFEEAALEAYLQGLVAKIPGSALVGMDCAEYPCTAVVAFTGDEVFQGYQAFQEQHEAHGKFWGSSTLHTDDETGEVDLMSWNLSFPAGLPLDEEESLRKRADFRVEDLQEALEPALERLRE